MTDTKAERQEVVRRGEGERQAGQNSSSRHFPGFGLSLTYSRSVPSLIVPLHILHPPYVRFGRGTGPPSAPHVRRRMVEDV